MGAVTLDQRPYRPHQWLQRLKSLIASFRTVVPHGPGLGIPPNRMIPLQPVESHGTLGGSVVLTRRRVVGILVGTMLALVLLLLRTGAPASAATTWNTGDVFVAVGNGSYNVYDNAGAFKQTITSPLDATTTGCSLNLAGDKLYTT